MRRTTHTQPIFGSLDSSTNPLLGRLTASFGMSYRPRMRLAWWALLVLAMAPTSGCRTRLRGQSVDLGPTPICRRHSRTATPATYSYPGDDTTQHVGVGIRLFVTAVSDQFCDPLADITTTLTSDADAGADTIVITSHLWHSTLPCELPRDGNAGTHERLVDVAANGPSVDVRDGAPGGTAELKLTLEPAVGSCDPTTAATEPGDSCTLDCQCEALGSSWRCLHLGPVECYIPCIIDSDCSVSAAQPLCDGIYCRDPASLGPDPKLEQSLSCYEHCNDSFGQHCDNGLYCRPFDRALDDACNCDSDCGEGRICTDGGRCIAPCTVLTDCPALATACVEGACR